MKTGIISSVNESNMTARVLNPTTDVVSGELYILQTNGVYLPKINDVVVFEVCNGAGVIFGSIKG